MAIVIDESLTASPAQTRLPSGSIALRQTLHSDLGGEVATVTYTLDARHNVAFQTAQGPAKQIRIGGVTVPAGDTERTDTVQLVEIGGGTGLAQVEIQQSIQAENTTRDSVTLMILS